jgi:hypothetical protein
MSFSERVVTLKLTSAIAVDGMIARAGSIIEMVEAEAKDLLRRGKAVIHAAAEEVAKETADDADQLAAAQAAAQAAAADAEKSAAKPAKAPNTGR